MPPLLQEAEAAEAAAAALDEQVAAEEAAQQRLLMSDLVSCDGCQRAVLPDAEAEAQLLLRFDAGRLGRPAPSAARAAADLAGREPEEELGLYVAPRPRVSNWSLYKMEQRLAKAVTIDAAALARHAARGGALPAALPAASAAARRAGAKWWFGRNGLMACEPCPLKARARAHKERPPRRWDQDLAATSTAFLPAAVHAGGRVEEGRSYRLDIALGRLEFGVHPLMAREHQLAARLLAMYRELKRRQSVGLAPFYARRLAALEDALLAAREALFAAQEAGGGGGEGAGGGEGGGDGGDAGGAATQRQRRQAEAVKGGRDQGAGGGGEGGDGNAEVLALAARLAALEGEVAEARQLLQEERGLLTATVDAMGRVWGQLLEVRARQGCALTDVRMHLVEVPPDDDTPLQQDGLTRRDLDVALLVAEAEPILGLPDWPAPLPCGGDAGDPDDFPLRRVEAACGAHARAAAELSERLAVLKGRVSADQADPEVLALEARLAQLGPAPRRGAVNEQQAAALCAWAEGEVAAGRVGVDRGPQLEPVLTVGAAPAEAGGEAAGPRVQGPRFNGKCRYYARLVINGRGVGTSDVLPMRGDFTVEFRDVFSVRLLKWPESLELQLWERQRGGLADRAVASLYLPVPGAGGTPHIDPQAKGYSWASQEPAPPNEAARAAAAAAVEEGGGASAAALALAPLSAGEAIYPSGLLFVRSGWVPEAGFAAVGSGAFGGPFSAHGAGGGADGLLATGDAVATLTLVQPFAAGGDQASRAASPSRGVAAAAADSPMKWRTYDNPLSDDGGRSPQHAAARQQPGLPHAANRGGKSPGRRGGGGFDALSSSGGWGPASPGPRGGQPPKGSPMAAWGGAPLGAGGWGTGGRASGGCAAASVRTNPLADTGCGGGGGPGWDLEVGPSLMPPQPAMSAEQALRRAVVGGGKASRAHAAKWLRRQPLDPNDPRNAALLELLRARDAGGSGGGGQAPSDLFRLGVLPDLALAADRPSDTRAAFLRRRWDTGALRQADVGGSRGAIRLVAPLSAKDTSEQQDSQLQALARLEAASLGLPSLHRPEMGGGPGDAGNGGGPAAVGGLLVGGGRQDRAIKDFALRLRAAAGGAAPGRGGGGRGGGSRRLRTDDVVKDTALPEFRLDLGALVALLQPARPLRPRRRTVRRVVASVPHETALVVTLQRAANLPARLALTGGRAQLRGSPPRAAANRGSRAATRESQGAAAAAGSRSTADWAAGGGAGWEDTEGEPVGAGEGLSCFVEVRFRGAARRTAAVDSNSPIWNEQVAFPVFDLDHEASPMALRESDGVVTLALFDEVMTPAARQRLERDRDAAAVRAARSARTSASLNGAAAAGDQGGGGAAGGGGGGAGSGNAAAWDALTEGGRLPERERRFLGCLRVPLAAIYQAESLEGSFRLEVPPVLLGYHQPSARPPALTAIISLSPRLAAPGPPDEERVWVPALRALPQCRSRVVRAVAVDPDGLGALLPRYVAPTRLPPCFGDAARSPPPDPEDLGRLMLSLARWAAALPFLEDGAFRRSRVDVWCGSAEALGLGGGDHEEHAHLLAGFFLAVGQEALVVLGNSLQGAGAAFVLTTGLPAERPAGAVAQPAAGSPSADWDVSRLRLWNPLTGQCVPVMDPSCELREVGTVYNSSNIWVNVQTVGAPWDLSWDLGQSSCWRPFFGPALPQRELAPMQVPPDYADLDPRVYEELEARVEETVRGALYEARGVVVTQPNNKLSRALKALLRELPAQLAAVDAAGLEASAATSEGAAAVAAGGREALEYARERLAERQRLLRGLQVAHNERVAREMRGCAVNGHVLSLPFSDGWEAAVTEAVLASGVHRTVDPRVKFAMAAHVEPLGAAFVCRVWVYVAAIRDAA
ncbi:MAG: hypothetical protein J3K34DRAFT_487137 [Monoraphidium minutum]|nr:MAG: hypothetical protein J3K34DRAFT_487137 [Monoraphidium minutum]